MDLYVVLKTNVVPSSLAASVQRIAAELDPEAALSGVQSMQTYVDAELSGRRAVGNVLVIFGAVAIVLAGMGVFGIISYSVSRQTREIGLRVALGARQRDIVRWFAASGLTIGSLGAAIGLALAAALARVLSGLLYQVSPVQPSIYLVLGMAVTVLSTGAAYLPARRAARVDPVRTLKQE